MKVLLVDDHPLILSALEAMIHSMDETVGVVATEGAAEAHAALAADDGIELVLLDLTLADADGFETLERIRTEHPSLPVVVISATDRMADVVRAVDLGAMGYVSKRSSNVELRHALTLVMAGGVYVPAALLGQEGMPQRPGMVDDEGRPAGRGVPGVGGAGASGGAADFGAFGLTPRQSDVLRLLLKGLPNKLIARELNLSVETVKDHVAAVLRTLGVSSRTQAVLAVSQMSRGKLPAWRPTPR